MTCRNILNATPNVKQNTFRENLQNSSFETVVGVYYPSTHSDSSFSVVESSIIETEVFIRFSNSCPKVSFSDKWEIPVLFVSILMCNHSWNLIPWTQPLSSVCLPCTLLCIALPKIIDNDQTMRIFYSFSPFSLSFSGNLYRVFCYICCKVLLKKNREWSKHWRHNCSFFLFFPPLAIDCKRDNEKHS